MYSNRAKWNHYTLLNVKQSRYCQGIRNTQNRFEHNQMQEFMVTWCNLACLLMTGPEVGLGGRWLLQERIDKA